MIASPLWTASLKMAHQIPGNLAVLVGVNDFFTQHGFRKSGNVTDDCLCVCACVCTTLFILAIRLEGFLHTNNILQECSIVCNYLWVISFSHKRFNNNFNEKACYGCTVTTAANRKGFMIWKQLTNLLCVYVCVHVCMFVKIIEVTYVFLCIFLCVFMYFYPCVMLVNAQWYFYIAYVNGSFKWYLLNLA